MPFHLIRDDITCVNSDVIVNAANSRLKMGGGVCGSIFRAAGASELQAACDQIGYCPAGEAVWTPGFHLPKAKWIIHTVGPVWQGGSANEADLLASCYRSSLRLCEKLEAGSIAFPLISAGIYGYPREQALHIAVETIRDFLFHESQLDPDVYLVLFTSETVSLGGKLFGEITSFLNDDAPILEYAAKEIRMPLCAPSANFSSTEYYSPADDETMEAYPACSGPATVSSPVFGILGMDDEDLSRIGRQISREASKEETFTDMLLRLIDDRAMTDAEAYHRANLDRRLFSKIRSNRVYQPTKNTALAFCIALRLSREESSRLLAAAGFAFMPSSRQDKIILYCLEHQHYDIFEINIMLNEFDLPQLGAKVS